MKDTYLAIDFGAGSGRVLAGVLKGAKLELEEIHRFENRQIQLGDTLYWDFLALFEEMKRGIKKAVQKGFRVRSIGIDTWGVDFGLVDAKGRLLMNPVCYRDRHVEGYAKKVFSVRSEEKIYESTGIQTMEINSIFRLKCLCEQMPEIVALAKHLLFMPDLFRFFLTGDSSNEYSIASTSQLLNAKSRDWDDELIERLELPREIFGKIVFPGEHSVCITKEIAAELGLDESVRVVSVASHDTASAASVVYADDSKRKAFLSSGTWSLLGASIDEPILSSSARLQGFSNEGGVDGKIYLLQNITGLWILQQLMHEWDLQGKGLDYSTAVKMAEASSIKSIIDVDDACFSKPDSMLKAIDSYCQENNQEKAQTQADYVRLVIESLAKRYKKAVVALNETLDSPIEELQIIGGGSKNALLNQLTANETGLRVLAGPIEASSIGNILMQLKALKGAADDNNSFAELAKNRLELQIFEPA